MKKLLLLLFLSCASRFQLDQGLPADQPGIEIEQTQILKTLADIPQCIPDNEGMLYYLLEEQEFYYCNGIELLLLNLKGEDGTSANCTVNDNLDSTYTIACSDGTVVTFRDGFDGNTGTPGIQGVAGIDGTSCSVKDNGNETFNVDCSDGTSVVVQNGFNSIVETYPENPGSNCTYGGIKLVSGIDYDRDGMLDVTEIDSSTYLCGVNTTLNPIPGNNGQLSQLTSAVNVASFGWISATDYTTAQDRLIYEVYYCSLFPIPDLMSIQSCGNILKFQGMSINNFSETVGPGTHYYNIVVRNQGWLKSVYKGILITVP